MHRIEGSTSDLVKTVALPCKKMNRTQWVINSCQIYQDVLDSANKISSTNVLLAGGSGKALSSS